MTRARPVRQTPKARSPLSLNSTTRRAYAPRAPTAPGDADLIFPGERLECRTRDLSETGVGVVAGSIYVGYTCVVDEGRALLVTLELPAGPVRMEATAAHYLRLDSGARDTTYLIGLRINSMAEDQLALYKSFLESLEK